MNKIISKLDDIFTVSEEAFLSPPEVEKESEPVVEKKDDLYDIKDQITKMGFKISDIDMDKDGYEVEVRKGSKVKKLTFSMDEMKTPEALLKSIQKELRK